MEKSNRTSIRLSRKVYEKLKIFKNRLDINTFSDTINQLIESITVQEDAIKILRENRELLKKNNQLLEDNKCNGCNYNTKNSKKN